MLAGVDKYGSVGPDLMPHMTKVEFSPPDTINVVNDRRNNNLIAVKIILSEVRARITCAPNGGVQTNTTKNEINLKVLNGIRSIHVI